MRREPVKPQRQSAFVRLLGANLKDIVRDRSTFFFVMVFPFLFMFLFLFISKTTEDPRYKVGVILPPGAAAEIQSLVAALAEVPSLIVEPLPSESNQEALESGKVKILVEMPPSLADGAIQIRSAADSATQVAFVQALIRDLTRPPGGPTIELEVAAESVNPFEFGMPAVLVMAFFSLATMGTTTPIIQLRERGSLRLLGMTPLPRITFITAHLASRMVIGLGQLIILLVIAFALGKLTLRAVPAVTGIALLGLAMLFALGYTLAGLLPTAEAANGVSGIILPVTLMFCGVILPLEFLPDWMRQIAMAIPITYLGDSLRHLMLGSVPLVPLWATVLILLAATGLLTFTAALTFRWERKTGTKARPFLKGASS